ncbi:hypothetical protein [Dyella tabacisoli]|nr:hypothetical protein [Dyella tabacisoli]
MSGKQASREVFLAAINKAVPWDALLALVEPAWPVRKGAGA